MFVGGFSNLFLFYFCSSRDSNWQIKVALFIFGFLSGLSNKDCSPFIGCMQQVVSSSRDNNHSLLVFMHRVITTWIYGAMTIFNGLGCKFTKCHFDTCTIWGQEKNFRMFFPSSCGQSDLLRLNLLKQINK